jgi:type IV secretory pathway TraG/TraD family ATPase VirD4
LRCIFKAKGWLGVTTSIIILEDCPPIKATKIRYYESEFFMKKLLPKVEITDIKG